MAIKRSYLSAVILGSFLAASGVNAASITIDGDMDDWLAGPPTSGTVADFNPLADIKAATIDDDWQGIGPVDPGYGGQPYDSEAMYLDYDENFLYVAVITGHDPADTRFGPGDIGIQLGPLGFFGYEFGLETTGSSEEGVDPLDQTTTNETSPFSGVAGGVYSVTEWANGFYPVADPTSILAGTLQDDGGAITYDGTNISYGVAEYDGFFFDGTANTFGGSPANPVGPLGEPGPNISGVDKHYFLEVAIPVAAFGTAWVADAPQLISLHWTMNCSNDAISLAYNRPSFSGTGGAPEPGSIALMGLGLVGMARAARRRKAA